MPNSIIQVSDVRKKFKNLTALDGVSFDVERGKIFSLLGPNGAGKTTLIRILTTLMQPDGGSAVVAGFDVVKDPQKVRQTIGLAGQYATVDENLTGRENLEMVGRLYHLPKAETKKRAKDILERMSLTDAANRPVKTYSGGMRRRLDLGASFITQPKILFLDEPTTGLDPRSRFELWDIIRGLVGEGTTVLLTTQYLEEADELADYIAIIDHGKLIAKGTADELKEHLGGGVIEVHVAKDAEKALPILEKVTGEKPKQHDNHLVVPAGKGSQTLVEVVRALDSGNIELVDLHMRKPSLDEVFLALTGKK